MIANIDIWWVRKAQKVVTYLEKRGVHAASILRHLTEGNLAMLAVISATDFVRGLVLIDAFMVFWGILGGLLLPYFAGIRREALDIETRSLHSSGVTSSRLGMLSPAGQAMRFSSILFCTVTLLQSAVSARLGSLTAGELLNTASNVLLALCMMGLACVYGPPAARYGRPAVASGAA